MLIGHQKIRKRLQESVTKNMFFQSYVFSGPESVGKFEVAKEFALQLTDTMKTEVSEDVDIFVLEPPIDIEKGIVKERLISVEGIRDALHFLTSTPFNGKRKVLIIRDAHKLSESAQNALLKTLEEPPAYAVIILVTHELYALLPTTISRCQSVAFHLVSKELICQEMPFHPQYGADFDAQAPFVSLGRPGLLIQSFVQNNQNAKCLKLFENILRLSEKPLRERLTVAESLSADVVQTRKLLMWWSGGLHIALDPLLPLEYAKSMHRIEKIEKLRNDLQQFPGSSRILLETFSLHW